jgi:hypothetical protein
MPKQPLPIFNHGEEKFIFLEPYVLPSKENFSTYDAWRKASGINDWNSQQGFYIYRANRLIQNGGWNRLRTKDEHTKYVRIALDFSPDLDEEFKINISKMQVQLPKQIRELINLATIPVIAKAKEAYKGNRPLLPQIPHTYIPNPNIPANSSITTNSTINQVPVSKINSYSTSGLSQPEPVHQLSPVDDEVNGFQNKLWRWEEIEEELHSYATTEEKLVLEVLFNRIRVVKGLKVGK